MYHVSSIAYNGFRIFDQAINKLMNNNCLAGYFLKFFIGYIINIFSNQKLVLHLADRTQSD